MEYGDAWLVCVDENFVKCSLKIEKNSSSKTRRRTFFNSCYYIGSTIKAQSLKMLKVHQGSKCNIYLPQQSRATLDPNRLSAIPRKTQCYSEFIFYRIILGVLSVCLCIQFWFSKFLGTFLPTKSVSPPLLQ